MRVYKATDLTGQTVNVEIEDMVPEAVFAVTVAWECGDVILHQPGGWWADSVRLVGLRIGGLMLEANQARAALGAEYVARLEELAAAQAVADAEGEADRIAADRAEAREEYGDWLYHIRTGG